MSRGKSGISQVRAFPRIRFFTSFGFVQNWVLALQVITDKFSLETTNCQERPLPEVRPEAPYSTRTGARPLAIALATAAVRSLAVCRSDLRTVQQQSAPTEHRPANRDSRRRTAAWRHQPP